MNILANNRRKIPIATTGVSYPLYTGLTDVFSLRDTLGTDPVVIKVNANGVTQDFKCSEIIDGTLQTFCASAAGVVVGIWSQINNTYWAATGLPEVVEAVTGNLYTILGHPCIKMGNSDWFSGAQIFNQNSIFSKFQMLTPSTINYIWYASTGGMWAGGNNAIASGIGLYTNPNYVNSDIEDLQYHTATSINNGVHNTLYVDGINKGITNARSFNVNNIGRSQSNLTLGGLWAEMVLFPDDQTANFTTIQNTLKTY